MKVCKDHIKTSGMSKRYLTIVQPNECELCSMHQYFSTHGKTRAELKELSKALVGKEVHS